MIRLKGAVLAAALWLAVAGCGFYFKTYRFKGTAPFTEGLEEQAVLSRWGDPLAVELVGPMQVWKYFAAEPAYGEKKEYWLVWFQNGRVVRWEKREE
ncbi:MAG: hypothetical protein HY714_02850 [Candidatus Omnitrophica bacterium]|nr:hypothetical protein [Candidatus Omnitrophota bacterium]